jgi:hypothetical protein
MTAGRTHWCSFWALVYFCNSLTLLLVALAKQSTGANGFSVSFLSAAALINMALAWREVRRIRNRR